VLIYSATNPLTEYDRRKVPRHLSAYFKRQSGVIRDIKPRGFCFYSHVLFGVLCLILQTVIDARGGEFVQGIAQMGFNNGLFRRKALNLLWTLRATSG